MLEFEDALGRILAAVPVPAVETVALAQADGRVLAETICAPIDLPPFDNSSMDGYAVRAADIAAATPRTPVRLRLAGKVPAGENYSGKLAEGACIRIFTGSPVPLGADSVVMQEETRIEPEHPDQVLFLAPAAVGENLRLHGEDVRRGQVLVEKGERLGPGGLSLLAAVGVGQVSVGRPPTVALLASGSELREPDLSPLSQASSPNEQPVDSQALAPGQIYESNRFGLAALVRRTGAIPHVFPLVPDTFSATRQALAQAFDQCEVVVTSGGVSVGELDFIKPAFDELGGQLEFWKVSIKPGRPFVFGRWRERFLFGLPGNPVSALVTFLLLVRPALLRWQGAADVSLNAGPGRLAEPFSNPGERRHFLRVKIDAAGQVRSAGAQASHILSSLAAADGLLDVPPKTTWPAGRTVTMLRWE